MAKRPIAKKPAKKVVNKKKPAIYRAANNEYLEQQVTIFGTTASLRWWIANSPTQKDKRAVYKYIYNNPNISDEKLGNYLFGIS